MSKNVKTYVDDVLKIADNTWNNIKKLFSGASGGVTNPTNPAPANTNPTDDNKPVTAPKITLKKKKCDFNSDRTAQGEKIANELKELLSKTPVPMQEVKKLFENTNKVLIAYVCQAYPTLADDIDNVFRFGFGFDKKDVFNFVLKPLIDRYKKIGLKDQPNIDNITESIDLETMKKWIEQLSWEIIETENSWDIANKEYNNKLDESQKRIDNATTILTTAANNKSNNIEKYVDNNGRKMKQCKLDDGTSIYAEYNDSGDIIRVHIDTDDDKFADVLFDKYGVAFTDQRQESGSIPYKYNNCPVDGYNYNDILALAQKIFGKWED